MTPHDHRPEGLRPRRRADGRRQRRARGLAQLRRQRARGAAGARRRCPRVDGIPALIEHAVDGFDRVFNILHGNKGGGEDGVLQGLLEAHGVPCTGSGVLGTALAMDKIRSKQVWLALGLPTPRYVRLAPGDDVHAAARELGLPVIVKPSCEGSSVGVSRVFDDAGLDEAVALAARYPGELLMEQLIEGQELTVGILGDEALPSIRIVPAGEYYDYHAKYVAEDTQYLCPGLEGEDESGDPPAVARGLPRHRLQRLEPRRRDARPRRRLLAARGQHRARHDQPLAGAEGRGAGRHRFRGPVLAHPGDQLPGGARERTAAHRGLDAGARAWWWRRWSPCSTAGSRGSRWPMRHLRRDRRVPPGQRRARAQRGAAAACSAASSRSTSTRLRAELGRAALGEERGSAQALARPARGHASSSTGRWRAGARTACCPRHGELFPAPKGLGRAAAAVRRARTRAPPK